MNAALTQARTTVIRSAFIVALVLPLVLGTESQAQAGAEPKGETPPDVPNISARSYTGGSAKVTVTGAFQIEADVPINTQASVSDGGMTWLQFGASGSPDPNALITVSEQEVGVSAGRGKQIVTAGGADCSGQADVTANSIAGYYSCKGITSYDAATGKMGTVDIAIRFTATS
jgi:hypothetical protein